MGMRTNIDETIIIVVLAAYRFCSAVGRIKVGFIMQLQLEYSPRVTTNTDN
jgi:hypothetical protein